MNKKYKVVTINGFRGILALIIIAFGVISGFIISPGWVCMKAWNHFTFGYGVAQMNLLQGIMLWAIIALSLYAINNKKSLIGFSSFQGLSPDQVKDIISRANDINSSTLKMFDFNKNELKIKNINSEEDIKNSIKKNESSEEKEEIGSK